MIIDSVKKLKNVTSKLSGNVTGAAIRMKSHPDVMRADSANAEAHTERLAKAISDKVVNDE